MKRERDVVLTGMPRSGSTFVCELLNRAANTVALDEPIDNGPWMGRPARTNTGVLSRLRRRREPVPEQLPALDGELFADLIARFFDEMRTSIGSKRVAISKNVGGRVLGAKFRSEGGKSGVRELAGEVGPIRVDKDLSDDFTLVVKHNTRFAALLEHLVGRFRTYAVVRNPLAMLASWQTVALPIRAGRGGMATRFDADLRARLQGLDDVVDRQFVLLAWFFDRYRQHLPREAVLRYEDVIASSGTVLEVIAPSASALSTPLQNKNASDVYDRTHMAELGRRLLDTQGPWWDFYSTDDIRAVMP